MENWKTQLSNPANISEIVLLSAIFKYSALRNQQGLFSVQTLFTVYSCMKLCILFFTFGT